MGAKRKDQGIPRPMKAHSPISNVKVGDLVLAKQERMVPMVIAGVKGDTVLLKSKLSVVLRFRCYANCIARYMIPVARYAILIEQDSPKRECLA